MSRQRIGKPRKVVLPDELVDDLHLIAAHRGVPVAEVIREALAQYVRRTLKNRRPAA